MKLQEAIDKRHSVREFEDKSISKSVITKLIKNATKAPSAKNEQPWKFYVVLSKDKRKQIIDLCKRIQEELSSEINKLQPKIKSTALKFYENMGSAPCIIFVFREKIDSPCYKYSNDLIGIAGAVENFMLSAVDKGLGTCYVGSYKSYEKEIKKIVGAKNSEELINSILLGYPKKGYKPLKREKKKLNEVMKII